MLNLVYKYIEIDMANLPHEWYFDIFCQMIMVPLLGYLGKCILCISVGVSWLLAVEQFTSWVASARCRDSTVQMASEDVSVWARLQRIATFLFIGALVAYLLTYLLTYYGRHWFVHYKLYASTSWITVQSDITVDNTWLTTVCTSSSEINSPPDCNVTTSTML